MTPPELTALALPYVRHALKASKPEVEKQVGRVGWVVLWPAWALVVGPILPIVLRIGIEIAVGLLAPPLLPVVEFLIRLLGSLAGAVPPALAGASAVDPRFLTELRDLLRTTRAALLDSVQATLVLPASALAAER